MLNKKIFILLFLNIIVIADFIRNDIGIVADTNTGLIWQDNNTDSLSSWESAVTEFGKCEILTLSGLKWRLPNINELKTLINYNTSAPATYNVFINTSLNHYMSSTTYMPDTSKVWYVQFSTGEVLYKEKVGEGPYYYKCVSNR